MRERLRDRGPPPGPPRLVLRPTPAQSATVPPTPPDETRRLLTQYLDAHRDRLETREALAPLRAAKRRATEALAPLLEQPAIVRVKVGPVDSNCRFLRVAPRRVARKTPRPPSWACAPSSPPCARPPSPCSRSGERRRRRPRIAPLSPTTWRRACAMSCGGGSTPRRGRLRRPRRRGPSKSAWCDRRRRERGAPAFFFRESECAEGRVCTKVCVPKGAPWETTTPCTGASSARPSKPRCSATAAAVAASSFAQWPRQVHLRHRRRRRQVQERGDARSDQVLLLAPAADNRPMFEAHGRGDAIPVKLVPNH